MCIRDSSKPDRIKAVIDNKVGKITKKEIMELCPDISKITVERTLTNLVKRDVYKRQTLYRNRYRLVACDGSVADEVDPELRCV